MKEKHYVLIYATPYYPDPLENLVLLVLKDRPEWQKGFLNLVGGKVEEGESLEEATLRELKEETGYEPRKDKTLKIGEIECGSEIVHCFKVLVDDQKDPKPRKGETEIVRWYPWRFIRQDKRLIPNLRVLLPLAMAGITDWKLTIGEDFTNSEINSLKITLPSNLHSSLKEKAGVTKIIETGQWGKWDHLL